jgi:hypothetical protein
LSGSRVRDADEVGKRKIPREQLTERQWNPAPELLLETSDSFSKGKERAFKSLQQNH